jgi:hypothetical protein
VAYLHFWLQTLTARDIRVLDYFNVAADSPWRPFNNQGVPFTGTDFDISTFGSQADTPPSLLIDLRDTQFATSEPPSNSTSPLPSLPTSPVTGGSSTNDDAPFTCHWEDCRLVFLNKHEISEHVKSTHGSDRGALPLPCKWGNCTSRVKDLGRHVIRQHLGKFVCNICSNIFARKDALERHRDRTCLYRCSRCLVEFNQSDNGDEARLHYASQICANVRVRGRKSKYTTEGCIVAPASGVRMHSPEQ